MRKAAMRDAITRELLTQLMEETVRFAEEHVQAGGIPFTALVVMPDGSVVGRGVNRVRQLNDVTAHAEVEALRDAGKTLGAPDLSGAVLLASGEPCAMCYMASVYAGVSRVYYAVDRNEAAAGGFDYRGGYKLFARDPVAWERPGVEKLAVERSLAPFQSFNRR
jgi:tRNA(Arg) A34 adenosine deaminase TadA